MRVQDCYGSVYRLIEESASYFILARLGDGRPFLQSKDGCTVLPDVQSVDVTDECEFDGYFSFIHRTFAGPVIVSPQMGYRVKRVNVARGMEKPRYAFFIVKEGT